MFFELKIPNPGWMQNWVKSYIFIYKAKANGAVGSCKEKEKKDLMMDC